LLFAANDGEHGVELWQSDGSRAGTRLVGDLRTGVRGSQLASLTTADGMLFFAANDGLHGFEPWVYGP
jgi:ELWxxDGT repeat protein